ncbi:uncharacterized protein [Aegilops tauschii subsp. strangulata]|uniref:uncharacterized protein n=1 Tax=Aegilops tauschii subsp. strangulata TaxID=200361 RepID=UPI001ABD0E55|nr:uncharacterized protein LOC120967855 [Aegilops tauschii subsp. strangulata]
MRGRKREERRERERKEEREAPRRMGEGRSRRRPASARLGVNWRLAAARSTPGSRPTRMLGLGREAREAALRLFLAQQEEHVQCGWCGGRRLMQWCGIRWPQRVGNDTCNWCTMVTPCSSCTPQPSPSRHSRSRSKDAEPFQLQGRVGRSGREGLTYLFYTDKSLLPRIVMAPPEGHIPFNPPLSMMGKTWC